MEILKKPFSLVLGLIAAAVLFHFVLTPFYEDSLDVVSVWHVLNCLMAVGVIATLAATYVHKRGVGAEAGDTNRFICANAAFYAAAVLAVLFFWNWFDDLTVGEDGQSETRRIFWVVINALFVILAGAVSAHLWRDASRT